MTDITTALETLYAHTNNVDLRGYDSYERAEYYRELRAALSTIEAELTRLRAERDSLDAQVRAALRYAEACRLSRDSP